jgi:hypothetical protein
MNDFQENIADTAERTLAERHRPGLITIGSRKRCGTRRCTCASGHSLTQPWSVVCARVISLADVCQ